MVTTMCIAIDSSFIALKIYFILHRYLIFVSPYWMLLSNQILELKVEMDGGVAASFRFRFRNVLLTGMLHQLHISWSSVTSCVHTKQQSYKEQQVNKSTTVDNIEVTEEVVHVN